MLSKDSGGFYRFKDIMKDFTFLLYIQAIDWKRIYCTCIELLSAKYVSDQHISNMFLQSVHAPWCIFQKLKAEP